MPGCPPIGPMDCRFEAWGAWTVCPVTCGGSGRSRRERRVGQHAHLGGASCVGNIVETRACGQVACIGDPAEEVRLQDCSWNVWDDWGLCSKCGGQRSRFRRIRQHAMAGGKPCVRVAAQETGLCLRQCHEIQLCAWAAWSSWSSCSRTCGPGGTRNRQRQLTLQAPVSLLASASRLYENGADGNQHLQQPFFAPWFANVTGVRLELVAAFVCGYIGRLLFASGYRRSSTATASVVGNSVVANVGRNVDTFVGHRLGARYRGQGGLLSSWINGGVSSAWAASGLGEVAGGVGMESTGIRGGYRPVPTEPASPVHIGLLDGA